MIVVVSDANILIDLVKVGLLDEFFCLDFDVLVPDLVWYEVKEPDSKGLERVLKTGRLIKREFNPEELEAVRKLAAVHRALSIEDCSCLWLCREERAMLLTNDKALTRIAKDYVRSDVHGVLWLLQKMVQRGILEKSEAAARLTSLQELNARLPKEKCRQLIEDLLKE
jgi:predicted nucleic acid-binding protein